MSSDEAPQAPPRRRLAWLAAIGFALAVLALGAVGWLFVDVDADGRATYQELHDGTAPMDGDTDGDGIADGWERDHGLDPLQADPAPAVPGSPIGSTATCSATDVLLGDCYDGETVPGDGGSQVASTPPSGKDGSTITFVLGGCVSLVAGVGARLISSIILHKA